MLSFFRKHQKRFFLFIAVIIISSFSFFGTFSARMGDKVTSKPVGKTIAGKKILDTDIEQMIQLIKLMEHDGVAVDTLFFESALFQNGIFAKLLEAYQPSIEEELMARFSRLENPAFYVHPHLSFIRAEAVWEQFSPQIPHLYKQCKEAVSFADKLALWIELYRAQKQFPQSMLKQVLLYQERQFGNGYVDSTLPYADLALFGWHTFEEWFGRKALALISYLWINAQSLAEKKGIGVSFAEAQAEMWQDLAASSRNASKLMQHLQEYHLSENSLILLWQRALSWKRICCGIVDSIYIDRSIIEEEHHQNRQIASVVSYTLPDPLVLENSIDLAGFQIYLHAIAGPSAALTATLPHSILPLEHIQQEFPELVQRHFVVSVAKVSKAEASLIATVKQMLEWELNESNFKELQEQFSFLQTLSCPTVEDRFFAIKELKDPERKQVDQYVRNQLLAAHPEWMEQALKEKKGEKQELFLTYDTTVLVPDFGLTHRELLQALEEDRPSLAFFQLADHAVCKIEKLDESAIELVSFKEAKNRGLLHQIAERVFGMELEEQADQLLSHWQELWDELYSKYPNKELCHARFVPYMEECYRSLIKGAAYPVLNQWELTPRVADWQQGDEQFAYTLDCQPGQWSAFSSEKGGAFFQLSSCSINEEAVDQSLLHLRDILGKEAQQEFAQDFFNTITETCSFEISAW